MTRVLALTVFCAALVGRVLPQGAKADAIRAAGGDIAIVPIAHASLAILYGTHVILIDPARFGPGLPRAPQPSEQEIAQFRNAEPVVPSDGEPPPATLVTAFFVRPGQLARFQVTKAPTLILITDIHTDHLDPRAIAALKTSETTLIVPTAARARLLAIQGAETMANGDKKNVGDVAIEAVPMYNLRPDPDSRAVWHAKGRGNGYVISIGGKRIYVSGDTACTPEMKSLKGIDVAFLPMSLPFTMSPAEAAECAKEFRPRMVYPYHYFESDPKLFESVLQGTGIEVRLREWYPLGDTPAPRDSDRGPKNDGA
jgi:L-ascorbate metabolism protein UlaG (beta-lactamase superfamily)